MWAHFSKYIFCWPYEITLQVWKNAPTCVVWKFCWFESIFFLLNSRIVYVCVFSNYCLNSIFSRVNSKRFNIAHPLIRCVNCLSSNWFEINDPARLRKSLFSRNYFRWMGSDILFTYHSHNKKIVESEKSKHRLKLFTWNVMTICSLVVFVSFQRTKHRVFFLWMTFIVLGRTVLFIKSSFSWWSLFSVLLENFFLFRLFLIYYCSVCSLCNSD